MVDTGARFSTLVDPLNFADISDNTVAVVGFSGTTTYMPLTMPLTAKLGQQTFQHRFLHAPQCPANLLGRDILVRCGASILCGLNGLVVTFPDGTSYDCASPSVSRSPTSQMLLARDTAPTSPDWADVYWGELQAEAREKTGIYSLYLSWKRWIHTLHPYSPPSDPLHVTLYYDCEQDDVYQDAFRASIEGVAWEITSSRLYAGAEGVAAPVTLMDDQLQWYNMSECEDPHVTLAVHVDHQAKDLGPMVKRLNSMDDWQQTDCPGLLFSPAGKAYQIVHATRDKIVLKHEQIEHFHG